MLNDSIKEPTIDVTLASREQRGSIVLSILSTLVSSKANFILNSSNSDEGGMSDEEGMGGLTVGVLLRANRCFASGNEMLCSDANLLISLFSMNKGQRGLPVT